MSSPFNSFSDQLDNYWEHGHQDEQQPDQWDQLSSMSSRSRHRSGRSQRSDFKSDPYRSRRVRSPDSREFIRPFYSRVKSYSPDDRYAYESADNLYHEKLEFCQRECNNLSPISSESSLNQRCLTDSKNHSVDYEIRTKSTIHFTGDVDLRVGQERQNWESKSQELRCQFHGAGCPVIMRPEVISRHEFECGFNPRNMRSLCQNCKLIVPESHNCVEELRQEYENLQKRTQLRYFSNLIDLQKASALTHVWVHFVTNSGVKTTRVNIHANDCVMNVLSRAVTDFGLIPKMQQSSNEQMKQYCENYQLVLNSIHRLNNDQGFDLLSVYYPLETQLLLLPKFIDIKISVRNLNYDHEHIIVSVPAPIPLIVDPSLSVADLKELICKKIPVTWDRHKLIFHGKKLNDYQVLFNIGLLDGDRVEVVGTTSSNGST